MNEKIKMLTPIVELDGDEMTRIIWTWVKGILLVPYIDLKTEYFDLGLPERELTKDQVTKDAAEAIRKYGVGVKCATITPNEERKAEYGLSEIYKSPNATIRAILDGTVFRAPITAEGIVPYVQNWKKPITIARHAYGDVYKNIETAANDGDVAELVITSKDGAEKRLPLHTFGGSGGIVQGIHNTDESIASFAKACMNYAVDTKQDLWFAAKDTISKTYDRRFRDIFEGIFASEYQAKFKESGIAYTYTLIDDAIARVIRSEGGFIWACKNYDGDVMSDMVATAYGSLAMMTSVLVSPQGLYEYEAAHGTVQKHYYKHKAGGMTSTNPVAIIFAWTGALRKRAELDGLPELSAFAGRLELAVLDTIAAGVMTGDLFDISSLQEKMQVDTKTFLSEAARRLE